nr:ATP synthase CF0 subunit I [Ostreobium quekettii]
MLENRRKLILSNLQEADKRAIAAQQKFTDANSQFETAKLKVEEIQNQSISTLQKEKKHFKIQTEEMIQRLEALKKETLAFQQQKTLKLLSKKIIQLSLIQVQEKLKNRVDFKFQKSVDNFYIALFRNYNSSI